MTRPRALPGCASVHAPAEPMVLDLAELAVRQPWGGVGPVGSAIQVCGPVALGRAWRNDQRNDRAGPDSAFMVGGAPLLLAGFLRHFHAP